MVCGSKDTVFPINGGSTRYYINIGIENGSGTLQPVRVIADSGNEVTLLTNATARTLQVDLDAGEPFFVKGISGDPAEFRKLLRWVKMGDLEPVQVDIGFAMTDEALVENLLGNEDLLNTGRYSMTFTNKSVTVSDFGVCGGAK